MSNLFKDTYRTLMIDQHFPDRPYITMENFDAGEQIDKCVNASVDSIHVSMKCHWGHSYYNTKFGTLHPALKGRDMAGELVREGRAKGLEVIGYYCIYWDNLAAINHPEWRFIGPDGKDMHWHTVNNYPALHTWRINCFMSGYRQYCLDQIEEFCSLYDIDGVFIDAFVLGCDRKVTICHCPVCMERYKNLGLDPSSDDPEMMMKMSRHWAENYAGFVSDIRKAMDRGRPGLSLSQNGGPLVAGSAVLEQMSWAYNEGGAHPYNAVSLRGVGKDAPQCGIPAGEDAYDAWPQSMVRLMTSTVLANGSRTFFFFLQGRYPDGTFENSKYDFLRLINEETAAKQQYVKDSEALTAAAVYHSELSQMEYGTRDVCGFNDDPKPTYYRMFGSMLDIFRGESIPVELLTDRRATLDEMKRFKLIVLPELTILTEREAALFEEYVRDGGNILVTGATGTRDEYNRERGGSVLSSLLGIKIEGVCDDYVRQGCCGYMRAAEHPYFDRLRKCDYYYGAGSFIKAKAAGASVIAKTVEPIDVETEENYIGWGFLPPGGRAEWDAMTEISVGKGKAIYCAAPLAMLTAFGLRWPAELIKGVCQALDVNAGIELVGSKRAVQATFTRQGGSLIVHLLNESVRNNGGDIVPVTASVKVTGFDVKSARSVYPAECALTVRDGVIEVPPVEIHTILKLEI